MTVSEKLNLLIASTSSLYGEAYLSYIIEKAVAFFNVDEIIFIPYARPSGISFENYTQKPKDVFKKYGIEVKGLHEFKDPIEAIHSSKGIFTGGGNTFLLLKTLYELNLIEALRLKIGEGIPYMGCSAGSNITGQTIGTTNDMPIVLPPSFEALGFLPFNINPHYLDPMPNYPHNGETRETRIKEFHVFNEIDVIGLREGSWLAVNQGNITLKGLPTARYFRANQEAVELEAGIII